MNGSSTQFKVGLFLLVSAGLLLALMALALGPGLLQESIHYRIRYEETVKGMVVGSQVNFRGVKIGKVSDMRFVDGQTEVWIQVDPERSPIQATTWASLDRAWVTGQVTVELEGWEPGGEALATGEVIPTRSSMVASMAGSMPELMKSSGRLMEEYRLLAQNLNLVLDEEGRGRLRHLLASLDAHLPSILTQLDQTLIPEIRGSLSDLRELRPQLQESLVMGKDLLARWYELSNHPAIEGILTKGEALTAEARDASAELKTLLRGNRRSLTQTFVALSEALREIKGLSRMLRSTPSALVFGRPVPERTLPASPSGGRE